MESDDLATAKALRRAKKREIQAWIAAFEEREGRSPAARDKEVVRPMFREFRDLEAKVAKLTVAEQIGRGDTLGASGGTEPRSPEESPSATPSGKDSRTGASWIVGLGARVAVRAKRDNNKRKIQEWVKEFEDREGHPPTSEDKTAITSLYHEIEKLDKRLATSEADKPAKSSVVQEVTSDGGVMAKLEGLKAEKKRVKREIKAWLEDFEAREGRAALSEDKATIRPLYKRHKDIEHELARISDEASRVQPETGVLATADTNHIPKDPRENPNLVTPMILSPKLSIEAALSKVTEREDGTKNVGAGVLAQESVSPVLLDSKENPHATESNILHLPFSGIAEVPVAAAERNELENPSKGSAEVDDQRAGLDGGDSTGVRPNGDRDAGLQEDDRRDSGRVDGSGNSANGGVVEQERSLETPLGEMLHRGSKKSGSKASPFLRPSPAHPLPDNTVVRNTYEVSSKAEASGDRGNALLEKVSSEAGQNITEREDAASTTRVDRSEDSSIGDADAGGIDREREVRKLPSSGGKARKEEEDVSKGRSSTALDTILRAQIPEDKPMAAQTARVARMRARFMKMKNLIDGDDEDSGLTWTVTGSTFTEEGEGRAGGDAIEDEAGVRSRWAILGDAVAPNRLTLSPRFWSKCDATFADGRNDMKPTGNGKLSPVTEDDHNKLSAGKHGVELLTSPMDDDAVISWTMGQISNLLLSEAPPLPIPLPAPSGLENLMAEASQLREAVDPPVPGYVKEYQEGVRGASLVVSSVGVKEVEARERDLELERLTAAREETNIYRARETNLLHREDQARQRVAVLEAAGERVLNAGKQAVIETSIARERALAPAFARARAGLEAAIRAQKGRVRELFGELRPGETVGGRRFRVDWRGVPQPVEIRLHCVRAVRDRLRRGSYVMLSSMAERLGGRVIRWDKFKHFDDHCDDKDGVDTEGGDSRPAASLPVQHGGRYFDRELRLDQSVYQLCPSKSYVRPGNVMVFELFRLAGSGSVVSDNGGVHCGSSRHKGGELDGDATVGWCVLPIADSRLRIVRGSFRVPMLRGEPNPNIDLHEGFEKLVAADLGAWLGNLYLDVRHMPRDVRLEESGIEGGRSIGGEEGFDIEYDHVRKLLRLGNGLVRNIPIDATRAVGRWTRWLSKKRSMGCSVIEDDRAISLGHDGTKILNITEGEANDVEAGLGSGTPTHAERSTGKIQTNERVDHDDSAMGIAQDTKGITIKTAKVDEREQEVAGAVNEGDNTAGSSMGVKKNRQGLGASSRDPDGQNAVVACAGNENRYSNTVVPKLVGAPPPVGSWADVEDDAIHTGETLDEKCFSDDDAARGSECLFTASGEAMLEVDTETGGATNAGGKCRDGGLRRRGEGAHWNSTALGRGSGRRPSQRLGGGSNSAGGPHVWTILTNPAEMEFYRFAVAADPGTDGPPTPAQVIRQKLRYIQQEILSDLHPGGWRVVDYWLAVMVFVGALWLRVYLHGLGQWFLLYSVGVPVFNSSARLWEFAIKFMDRSSSLEVEIAFVWWGPTFVTLCFTSLAGLARLWRLAACGGKGGGGGEGLPKSFSRFVAAFGVGAILDPYLLFLIDIVAGNHDCSAKCADYTSPACRCHEGDAWKLYVRLETEEGAGISGVILTVMIYALSSMTTVLIFHQYLLHVHMNGRMLDVWRRLNAGEDDFFVPHDFEVSAAELHHACVRARKWRGVGGALRTVVIHDFCANDEEAPGKALTERSINRLREGSGDETDHAEGARTLWKKRRKSNVATPRGASRSGPGSTTHVAIYEVTVEGNKSLHRQFLQASDGMILEVFGEAGRGVGWELRSSLNALVQEETDLGGSSGISEKVGIFAGMLPDPVAASLDAAAGEGDGGGSANVGDNTRYGSDFNTADIGIAGEF